MHTGSEKKNPGHKIGLTNILVKNILGKRKQDSKYWRNHIDPNRQDPEEVEKKARRRSIFKIIAMTCLLLICFLATVLYWKPPFLEPLYSSKYVNLVHSFYYELTGKLDIKPISTQSRVDKNDKENRKPQHYTFSDSDIEKAKQELLREGARKEIEGIDGNNLRKQSAHKDGDKEENYLYEIELHSGGRISTTNLAVGGDKITYSNERGLFMSINSDEVKSVTRQKIPE